ncbi:MAG: hypothetical protein ACOCYG_05965 [Spirochaetota bacterium]
MLQFYLLSVLSLILGGAALAWGTPDANARLVRQILARRWTRIGIGAVAAVTGIIKLFVRAPGDTVPVAGDLLPALVGIAVAVALGAELWAHQKGATPETEKVRALSAYYKLPLGILSMATGLVHFFVPGAVII